MIGWIVIGAVLFLATIAATAVIVGGDRGDRGDRGGGGWCSIDTRPLGCLAIGILTAFAIAVILAIWGWSR